MNHSKIVSVIMLITMFIILTLSVIGYSNSACAADGVLRDSNGRPVLGCSMGGKGC